MRRLLVLIGLLAACRDIHDYEPPIDALTGPHVRVATFNVRRFFDTICDSGACASGDYEELPDPAEFDARAVQLAAAIRALDADIIGLDEIESQPCLDALLSRLTDVMPYGVIGETGFAASVDVAVLSKTPLENVTRHRDAEPLTLPDGTVTTFSRELLEVEVHAQGAQLVLFAAHFKSKSDDDPLRRLAEAQASARIVAATAAREPAAIVILGGDLNDTPGSPPLDALTVAGGLVRLADDLPVDAQATYIYNGRGQSIDHLLLAPNATTAVRAPFSSRAWADGNAAGFGGSDHRALTTELALPVD